MLSLFYGPTLTSIHDYCKNHTVKAIDLTRQTFVGKVMSLLFNTLSSFITAFLPWSKCLNFMAAVTVHSDFEAHENKICHCFTFPSSICHEVMETDAMILKFSEC